MRKAAPLVVMLFALPALAQTPTPPPASLVREGVTEKLTDRVWAIPDGSASLVPPIQGVDPKGNKVERHARPDEPFAALAFKIMTDSYVGQLVFVRVYSGTLKAGQNVRNSTQERRERVVQGGQGRVVGVLDAAPDRGLDGAADRGGIPVGHSARDAAARVAGSLLDLWRTAFATDPDFVFALLQ